jgi:hypothetical protein
MNPNMAICSNFDYSLSKASALHQGQESIQVLCHSTILIQGLYCEIRWLRKTFIGRIWVSTCPLIAFEHTSRYELLMMSIVL